MKKRFRQSASRAEKVLRACFITGPTDGGMHFVASIAPGARGRPRQSVALRAMSDEVLKHAVSLFWLGVVVAAAVSPLPAARKEPAPKALRQVGVKEYLNTKLPLDLTFRDSQGQRVTLADFFDKEHPAILTLNYSSCPMLCSLQLTGLFDGLKQLKWDLGDQYRMITVSIDPKETPERALLAKRRYLRQYGRSGVASGYECLTGSNENIKQLADTVGFRYRYVPETGEYAHAAVTILCTPDGRVSRYLYGVEYAPQTLRLALTEASEGRIGSTVDQLLLFCFDYDAAAGKYGPSALKLMRLGGILTVFVIGGILLVYWRREPKVRGEAERTTDPSEETQ